MLDTIIETLKGGHPGNGAIRECVAQHVHTRRHNGYSLEQVIWGFAILRRLPRETVEEIATTKSREDVFAARELIRQITDRSEIVDRPSEVQPRLVDGLLLLDVNRISQGLIQLKKEQIDLRSPIKGAIDAFLPAIEEKAIKFQFRGADRAVTALADPVHMDSL